jgi:hypothetical protein
LITMAQAAEAGMSRRSIDVEVERGRLIRVREGVLAIAGAPPSWRQQVRATLLSLPDDLYASHGSALRLLGGSHEHDLGSIHVVGPLARQVDLPGVVGHRSGLLDEEDVTSRNGIRCTGPLRTVIDLSGPLDVRSLGRVVDDFLRRRLLDLEELRLRVAVTRPAPGRSPRTLRAVLAARIPGYDPGESELEGRIRRVIDRCGFPRPTQQYRVTLDGQRYRLDFAWPEFKVFLEGNGFGFHRLAADLDRDARRRNLLVAEGWRPLEVTWRMTDAEIEAGLTSVLPRHRSA